MGRKRRFLASAVAITILAALAFTLLLSPSAVEPEYQGKPLSYWLDRMSGSSGLASISEADHAISEIGTNAVPVLLQMLRASGSPLKTNLLTWASQHSFGRFRYVDPETMNLRAESGFFLIAAYSEGAVPELIRILDQNISPKSAACTARVLGYIGPAAKAAVPALLRSAASTNKSVSRESLYALGRIHANSDAVVPLLVLELRHPSTESWNDAVGALGTFGPAAKSAVPALVEAFNDLSSSSNRSPTDFWSRIYSCDQVANSLSQIDHDACSEIVSNLMGQLGDPSKETWIVAVDGLRAFGSDAKPAVPYLLKLLDDPDAKINLAWSPDGKPFNARPMLEQTLWSIDSKMFARFSPYARPDSNPPK